MAVNYYKKDKKTGKWVIDEKMASSGAKKSAQKATSNSAENEATAWAEYVANRTANIAAQDAQNAFNAVKKVDDFTNKTTYQLGGKQNLLSDRGLYGYEMLKQQIPQYLRGLQSGNPTGMSTEENRALMGELSDVAENARKRASMLTARTGGISSIDTSGMKKAEVNALGQMDNLSRRDDVYEKLQKYTDQEAFEHNRGEIFGGMSEKEYLDRYTAYLRDQQNQNAQQAKMDKWQAGADAAVAEAQKMPGYEELSKYVPDVEYLTPDIGYLEGYGNYTTEAGETISASEYRKNATDAFLAAFVDAGNDPEKRRQIEFSLEMMPELNNYNIEAIPYMTEDQKGAFFARWNSGDRDGAKQMLKTLDYGLQAERVLTEQAQIAQDLENANWAEKVLYSIGTVPQNLLNEAVGATQALAGIFNPKGLEDLHEYSAVYDAGREAQTVRGEIGQDIAEATDYLTIPGTDINIPRMAYNAIMSSADSAANAFLFGGAGSWAPTLAMGSGAFANEYMNSQDYWDALVSMGIEAGTEYLPFDIMGNKAMKPGTKILSGMLAEGLGESTAEVLNIGYDVFKNVENSEAQQNIDMLISQGYTPQDALRETVKKYGLKVVESGLTGALSGEISNAPSAIQANIENRYWGNNIINNKGEDAIMDLADTLPVNDQAKDIIRRMRAEKAEKGKDAKAEVAATDTDAATAENVEASAKAAEKTARDRKEMSGRKKGEKAVKNAEVGYVYREVMRTVDAEAQNVVANTLAGDVALQLSESGFTGDVKKAARDIVNFISGKTDRQTMRTIEGSSEARRIALEYTAPVDRMMRAAERRSRIYELAGDVAQRARKDFVKPEATKAEKGAEEATKGVEDRAVITAADVEIADTPESTVDGQAVTIEGVANVSDIGTVTYTVKDSEGNTREVSEDDVSIGQNDAVTAVLVENARELGANAKAMIETYSKGQNVEEYVAAYRRAFQYGEDGRNLDVVKGYSGMNAINEAQIDAAYEAGRARRKFRNAQMERRNASGIKVGRVDTSAVDMGGLTQHQRTSIHTMSRLAKAAGFNIRFVESKANAEGNYTTENGSWDPETLTLTLDVHAGSNKVSDVSYAMMHTAGHELTHYIKQFADTGLWDSYQEFVIGHLSTKEDGVFDLEDRINKQIENARKKGRNLTRDDAIEEIIANASGEALNSITEADIQALAETNPSLLNKVKQFFARWIKSVKAAIKAAYSGTEAKTAEAKQMIDAVDEMGRRWNELFVNAAKNRAVASETTTDGVEVSESGEAAYAGTELMYDLRTFNESDYVTERDKAAAALAKRMGVTQEKAERYIDDVTSIAAMVAKDRDRLDFESEDEYTALKHNSEYKFTVDFSTLCKKRLLYTGTFDAIQKQMPETALTEDDYIRLRQMMADRGYEVACAFCYVESRRKNNGEIINKFLDVYKNAQNTGGQMELGPSNRRKAFRVEEGFTPNIADFNTSEGIANIMHNHRGVYDAYMYFMNARGVSKPKLIESRTAYNSEILKKFRSVSAVRSMNRRGGLRLQSFSDFEVVNMLDMMQVVMDMSRVGLMSQAYTKVPAFARAFGGTGVKINLSLVTKGVDKNGKLIFDDIEGMPHEEAFKIRDMYSENVGTILVGKDDETIRAAMADPRIDFIIPYHASGWSTENQNALGIGGYTNFTAGQNETNAATGKGVKNFQPSEYWDYSKTGDENAQTYLEKCREAGRVPKFPQYQNYPGYWKMLIDFKMYDNKGNGSPQRAVRPDFNLSEAGRIMDEYTGGHQNLPVAHDVVRDFVKEYEGKQDGKKYSDRDAEYQDAYDDYDDAKARELVREAAAAAGYDSPVLYHGTSAFGFTEIDPAKADDGISFFTTTSERVAESYSGESEVRRISSKDNMNPDDLLRADGDTLLELLRKHIDKRYEIVNDAEKKKLIKKEEDSLLEAQEKVREFESDKESILSGNVEARQAVTDIMNALSRMRHAETEGQSIMAMLKFDDAFVDLRFADSDLSFELSNSINRDVNAANGNKMKYLHGSVFKIDYGMYEEYAYYNNAIDMLYPKLFRGIYELYGRTDGLFEVDADGKGWNQLDGEAIGRYGFVRTRDYAEYAKAHGYSGVHFKNIRDTGGQTAYNGFSDVYTFFNPEDVKSADPFTYDDDGNLIPLSQRFDRSKSDIRYSIREADDGRQVVVVDDDILKGIYSGGKWTEEQKEKARDAAKTAISSAGPIYSEGIPFYINARTKKEFPSSKYVWNTLGKTEDELADRFRISSETENLVLATVGWKDDPLTKNRTDFVKFVKGKVYMEINGHKYEGTVVAGVNSKGKHVLYDLVDMNTANFKMKEEDISSTDQANAATDYSKMSSTEGSIPQNSKSGKTQMRDYDELSDRELLVRALETELTPAERDHLERYKKKVDGLAADQRRMEELNSRIVELKNAGYTARTSEELRVAETNATTLRKRIDKKDVELKGIESADMIREVIRRNRAEARSKAYALARQRADGRQRKAVEHAREVGERRVERLKESQSKEKYKKRIIEDVKKLHTWVASPTNKGSAPEFLREPLAEFIESIDFSSARLLKGGDPTQRDIKFTNALDKVREAVSDLNKQYAGLDSGAEAFAGFVDLTGDYAEEFDKLVRDIKNTLQRGSSIADTPINKMSADQLKELSQMFKILRTSIRQMNMNLANSRYESNRAMSRDGIDELGEMKARTKTNKALELLNSTFNWKNTTPYYAFERLGRAGKAVFEALQDGWDKMAYNSSQVIEYSKDTFDAKESRAWSSEISKITLDSGDTIQMTTAQKMSLYCHTKREQSRGHLMGGGIRMSDIDGKGGSKITQAEDYVLTEADIDNIVGSLTDRQKEVADKLQRFMNTVCAEWGNEISMKRFGFEQMTEKNYFPIKTDSNNRASIDEDKDGRTSMFRLLNMSSLKPLTPGANNAIIIEDIFNVFSDHASDMAKYNALALPILDFIKWYNYVERNDIVDESGNPTGKYTTRSTQKSLERVFGKDAKEYLRAFIKDLNAEHDGGRNDGLINSIVGRAKSAAVGANLRVYGLQITSLPRAAYAINPVYLAKGLAKVKSLNPVNAIKGTEAQQKVGILKWKDLGFYSTDIGRSTRGMVKRDEGLLGKIRDWSMAPAGWGDNWVSNIIYEAAKAEMKAKNPEIKPGSAEYDRRLNKRVREIVYKTQVVDSTMTRSDFMRSKGLASTLTAFMSEPTLTVNMLNESIQKAVETARKGGNVRDILRASSGMAARAATTFAVTACITSLVESMFDALRDDDEYETFRQKFMDALWGTEDKGGNLVENFNIFAMLPYIKDVISIFQGYENSSLITQGWQQVQDFKTSIESWQNGKAPIYRVVYNGAKAASSMGGIAVGNAMRDFVSMYNTFLAPAWGTPKLQTYEDNETTAATAYYKAVKAGDTELAEYYRERMNVTGMDMAKVEKKLATLAGDDFVSGGMTEAEARKWLTSEGGYDSEKADTKMRDLNFKKETGVNYSDFKSAYVAGTISKSEATRLLKKYREYDDNQVYFTLQEWDGGEDWTKYGNFLDAVDAQGNYAAEGKKLLDHGVDKSDIARAISTAYKDAYREIHGTYEGNRLLEYLLDVYEAIGYDRDYERRYITKNWLKD